MHIRSISTSGVTMAVYLFTYHAYRSWMPDRPQGYVAKNRGILPQDPGLAKLYHKRATNTPVVFSEAHGWIMIRAVERIVSENSWLLYETAVAATHVHILVGWREFQEWKTVSNRLKRGIGLALSREFDRPGPWFSRGGSRKRISSRKHFEYLLDSYLPEHGAVRWTNRDAADMHPQLTESEEEQQQSNDERNTRINENDNRSS